MVEQDMITIEVAYALPDVQRIITLQVEQGTTLQQAVGLSGICSEFPAIDPQNDSMGIFGKVQPGDTILRHMDRVEIYRPLLADPKEIRKLRAAQGKTMKKGSGTLKSKAEQDPGQGV